MVEVKKEHKEERLNNLKSIYNFYHAIMFLSIGCSARIHGLCNYTQLEIFMKLQCNLNLKNIYLTCKSKR